MSTSPDLMTAIATEHSALEIASSSTVSESSSRTAAYLSALSSSLVAIGFAASSPAILLALAGTVLPTVFLLGCLTVMRLVDTSVRNVAAQRRIRRIREFYARLSPEAATLFPVDGDPASGTLGIRYSRLSVLSTSAAVVGVVNATLGGSVVALLLTAAIGTVAAVTIGVLAAVPLAAAALVYTRVRIRRAMGQARG